MRTPDTIEQGHERQTLSISALASVAVLLDTTVLFVAFPDIEDSFPTVSAANLSWVLNAYTIAFAALLVPAGKLADRLGHKRALLAGSIIFTAASAACGLAPNVVLLIGFRVVQAVGAAVQIPSSLALILRAFPKERIPVAVAIWGATGAFSGALGPALGAMVVDTVGWRWVFFMNIPIGIAIVWFGSRRLRESLVPDAEIPEPVGVVLIASAAALLSLAAVQGETWGWSDLRTFVAVIVGLVVLVAFVNQQRRTSRPTLDLELFLIRDFSWGTAATFVFFVAFTAMFFGSILFLIEVWDYSILRAGFGVAPGPFLVALLAPVAAAPQPNLDNER